ncbi:hypothetical protein HPB50_018158 [Hyalomma asiaticum]|uniref:Uncharacterized protein n=1 Tax=Hyalomma asiaticum TaxID=266040 RepID=A0ACB7S0C3_HYAAI|nr:hypothetical protein HPB50_018158 [Hyalomma asiaticum]
MTLMRLLLVQVPLFLFSTVYFEAAERGAQPFSSDPWIASTVSRLSSTRVHGSSSVVGGMCGPSHGWISEDQPIDLGQQHSRGADQQYIDTQHDGFVGFGAGTLADMTLMRLLLVQPALSYPAVPHVSRVLAGSIGGGIGCCRRPPPNATRFTASQRWANIGGARNTKQSRNKREPHSRRAGAV